MKHANFRIFKKDFAVPLISFAATLAAPVLLAYVLVYRPEGTVIFNYVMSVFGFDEARIRQLFEGSFECIELFLRYWL